MTSTRTTATRTATAGQVRTPSSMLTQRGALAPWARFVPHIDPSAVFGRTRVRALITCLTSDGRAVAKGLTEDEREAMFPRSGSRKFTIAGTVRRSTQWWMYAGMARSILAKRGLRLVEPQLGCGTFGCAYLVDGHPDVVLKLTGDRSEAAAAQTVITSGYRDTRLATGIARFLCVYGFLEGPWQDARVLPFFAVLQERLLPTTKTEQEWFDTWGGDLLDAAAGRPAPFGRSRVKLRELLAREAGKKLGIHGPDAVRVLWEAVEGLDALGIDFTDMHGGNVLVARDASEGDRRYKIIDLGISLTGDQQVPALAGARMRRGR